MFKSKTELQAGCATVGITPDSTVPPLLFQGRSCVQHVYRAEGG